MTTYQLSKKQIHISVDALIEVFKKVRPQILMHSGNIDSSSKADGSVVTKIDIEIEDIISNHMIKASPNIPVFGEESGYDHNALPAMCWLIDPIDGTESYISGDPYFTNMGVLIIDDEAVASVIYNPTNDDLYVAFKDGGAFKNEQPLDLKLQPLPKKCWCRGKHIKALNKILRDQSMSCEIAPAGGGYGFTMVAEGTSAARFQIHSRGGVHDYAPGALLVKEAGGDIVPILSKTYNYKSKCFVACHPKLGELVRSHIKEIQALELMNPTAQV